MEIVAELTYNHFGSIERAKKMINSAKNAGATCVKFEIRNNSYYFRNNLMTMKKKSKYEFNDNHLKEFSSFCEKIAIGWFASVHDIHSLMRILPFSPKYIKIASREARLKGFLDKVKEINNKVFPLVVSTGGLSFLQVSEIYGQLKGEDLTLLHASCLYPCPDRLLNLNRITLMQKKFKCKIGYSGHERGFLASIYAAFLDVDYLERHFTLEERVKKVAKGSGRFKDEQCTLSPSEFRQLTDGINKILNMKMQLVKMHPERQELARVNYYGVPYWNGKDVVVM